MTRLLVIMMSGLLLLSGCVSAGPGAEVLPEIEVVASEVPAVSGPEPSEPATPRDEPQTEQSAAAEIPNDPVPAQPEAPVGETVLGSRPSECAPIRGGGDHLAQLVDVRVGSHPGFDRVVLELAPSSQGSEHFGMPRYQIAAADLPITEDGSGHPVAVEGSHHAAILLHGASGVEFIDADPGYVLTYQGPRELKPGFPVLVEAEQTGDFERTLSWAFGLARPSCWEVGELTDPLRLVIDFPH